MISASVQERLRRFDPALRLREVRGLDPSGTGETIIIAVERKDRGGSYQRIGTVRPDLLGDGTGLIATLKASDVREYGGGPKAADAYDAADATAAAERKRSRTIQFEDMAKDGHDIIARRTGRRVNNAGIPE